MPTYEYVCTKCGHEMEAFQSMTDAPLRKCPSCGRLQLKRKIGAGAGLIFKGTGFYVTDYKKSNSSPATESSAGASKSTETPPKTASKPAASASAK